MSNCPTPDELRTWATGDLSSNARRRIDVHVLQCPHCLDAWDALDRADRPADCPSVLELTRRQTGRLGLQRSEQIGRHSADCSHCHDVFERLKSMIADSADQSPTQTDPSSKLRKTPPVAPQIAGYELLCVIKSGGQGDVFKAVQRATNRTVAVKLLRDAFPTNEQRERFKREVELVANMRHPHIVTIFDSGITDDDRPYYSMEFIDGEPLGRYLTMENPTIDQRLRLFESICEAVEAAHRRGVVHRDLKPGNIMVDRQGQPRVLDFGMARQTVAERTENQAAMTQEGVFLGTYAYAAPEQFEGRPEKVTVRTDVFALGTVLYEMLTGRRAFEGATFWELERTIRTREPVRPTSASRGLNGDLDTIVLRALAKEPTRRYATAGALARDVGLHLAGEPIEARRDSAAYIVRRRVWKYRLPISIAAVIVLLVGATSYFRHRAAVDRRAAEADRQAAALAAVEADRSAARSLCYEARTLAFQEPDAAAVKLQAARQFDPSFIEPLIQLAQLYWRERRTDEAIATAEAIVAEHQDHAIAHALLARYYERTNADKAAMHLAKVGDRSKIDPFYLALIADDAEAVEILTNLIAEQGEQTDLLFERASRNQYLFNFDAMLDDAIQLTKLQPKSFVAWNVRGSALKHLRRLDEAIACFNTSIELNSENVYTYLHRADARIGLGKNDEAIEDCNEALRIDPEFSLAWATRAIAFFARRNLNQAKEDAEKALSLNNSTAQAHYCIGRIRARQGNHDMARQSYDLAIEANPRFFEAWFERGMTRLEGDVDGALADMDMAIRLRPNDAAAHNRRATIHLSQGRTVEAIEDAQEALRISPEFDAALYNLGRLRRIRGDLLGSVASFSRAIELSENSSSPYVGRAISFYLIGRDDEAIQDLEYALARRPTPHPLTLLYFWQIEALRGNNAKAEESLELAASRLSPSNWGGKIVEFCRGRLSTQQLLAEASSDGQHCDAYYYIGVKCLIKGDINGARASFRECVATDVQSYEEYHLAKWRLRSLSEGESPDSDSIDDPITSLRH